MQSPKVFSCTPENVGTARRRTRRALDILQEADGDCDTLHLLPRYERNLRARHFPHREPRSGNRTKLSDLSRGTRTSQARSPHAERIRHTRGGRDEPQGYCLLSFSCWLMSDECDGHPTLGSRLFGWHWVISHRARPGVGARRDGARGGT
jgi:hypothetical protein